MNVTYRAEVDLEIYQGANFEFTITVMDENEAPIDLSGYTAKMDIRPYPGGEVLLSASTSNGLITIDGVNGEVGISIDYASTNALPSGTLKYDVFIQSGDASTRRCIAEGDVIVTPRITEFTS